MGRRARLTAMIAREPGRRVARLVLLLLVTAVAAVSVVGRAHDSSAKRPASQELEASLVLNVTGGIGDADELMVVRSTGAFTIDTGRGEPVRGRLPDHELEALKTTVREANLDRPTRPGLEHVCCDRLLYSFSYGDRHYATISGEVPEPVKVLVDALKSLAPPTPAGTAVETGLDKPVELDCARWCAAARRSSEHSTHSPHPAMRRVLP
jgi:hypothetical protein